MGAGSTEVVELRAEVEALNARLVAFEKDMVKVLRRVADLESLTQAAGVRDPRVEKPKTVRVAASTKAA